MTKKDPIPEIRQRPAKSDQELLDEYFTTMCQSTICHGWSISPPLRPCKGLCHGHFINNSHRAAIEKELGMDKINAERIRRLEERVTNQAEQLVSLKYWRRAIVSVVSLWACATFIIVIHLLS